MSPPEPPPIRKAVKDGLWLLPLNVLLLVIAFTLTLVAPR